MEQVAQWSETLSVHPLSLSLLSRRKEGRGHSVSRTESKLIPDAENSSVRIDDARNRRIAAMGVTQSVSGREMGRKKRSYGAIG